jgi:hypothetical protein
MEQRKRNEMKSFFIVMTILSGFALFNSGCQKTTPTPAPATTTCSNPGTSVNIGGSAGGFYTAQVASSGSIGLDNTNLNLSILSTPAANGTIMDTGIQNCPDFSYSGTPTASQVAYKKGHGYVGKFNDGHIVKFVTTSYSGGVALIAYIYQ